MKPGKEFSKDRAELARWTITRIIIAFPLLFALACSGDDSAQNPAGPPITGPPTVTQQAPVIIAIQPTVVASGDRITIRGEHFRFEGKPVAVSVAGIRADVISVTEIWIEATAPNVAALGPVPVVVTVGDRSSAPFPLTMWLPRAPSITTIEPASARPVEEITIRGAHFGSSAADLSVTIGGVRVWGILSVNDTAVVLFLPTNIPIGPSPIVVSVRGQASSPFAFEVLPHPNLTGAYSVQATVTRSTCSGPSFGIPAGAAPPVGSVQTLSISLVDNRPDLSVVVGDAQLTGTITYSTEGQFISARRTVVPPGLASVSGIVTSSLEMDITISYRGATFDIPNIIFPGTHQVTCDWEANATGSRISG